MYSRSFYALSRLPKFARNHDDFMQKKGQAQSEVKLFWPVHMNCSQL